jgi:hypothetical protein
VKSDSLVQTASGFNAAEAEAFGAREPKPLPAQAPDHATGYLMAFGMYPGQSQRSPLPLLVVAGKLSMTDAIVVSRALAGGFEDTDCAWPASGV